MKTTDYNQIITAARIAAANGTATNEQNAIRALASAIDQIACYKSNATDAIEAAGMVEKHLHGI